jgi:hypothetical protein
VAESPADFDRIQLLGKRVRWLDRYRRVLSIASVAILLPVLMRALSEALGADWPEVHTTLLAVMLSAIAWWMIEIGLAWLAAIWETECDHLIRDRGLPRAELLRPRRK